MTDVFTKAAQLHADGLAWRDIVVRDGVIDAVLPTGEAPRDGATDLGGTIVSVPMCDVQVNGGGGLMLGDCKTVADLKRMADAHLADGVPHILPTLISDTVEQIAHIVTLIEQARADGVWQILGLHLEGPHITQLGAHDPAMLRPLTEADLARCIALKPRFGILKSP